MTIDIDAAWKQEQDDVINVVADIECPSARIQYAFQAGCLTGRDLIARVVDERTRLEEKVRTLLAERGDYVRALEQIRSAPPPDVKSWADRYSRCTLIAAEVLDKHADERR